MKYIVLFISGVKMLHSFREPSVFFKLILLMLLGATAPGRHCGRNLQPFSQ